MTDPFTESEGEVFNRVKISDGPKNMDSRHMNTLDNGMLLCLVHHAMMDNLWFTIHPDVSRHLRLMQISSFLPRIILSMPSILGLPTFISWVSHFRVSKTIRLHTGKSWRHISSHVFLSGCGLQQSQRMMNRLMTMAFKQGLKNGLEKFHQCHHYWAKTDWWTMVFSALFLHPRLIFWPFRVRLLPIR